MSEHQWGRREFLTAAMGLLATGCSSGGGLIGSGSPDIRPLPPGRDYGTIYGRRRFPNNTTSLPRTAPQQPGRLRVVPRRYWTDAAPIAGRVNPMGDVQNITVHHEGSSAFTAGDVPATTQRIEKIRHTHVEGRGWGDIGYHYIIDRAGRVWEARPSRYQGAHVKNHNSRNLGVMCLGNFEIQSPSAAQVAALERTIAHMMRWYRVPVGRVFTHRELAATACPGRLLQPRLVAMRRSGVFA